MTSAHKECSLVIKSRYTWHWAIYREHGSAYSGGPEFKDRVSLSIWHGTCHVDKADFELVDSLVSAFW